MSIVKLINYTPNPQHTVALAALICYSSKDLFNIKMSEKYENKLLNKLIKNKHYSPFEHVSFTFYISQISRSCMCQLTRHRIASYSVRSQRYVNENNFNCLLNDNLKDMNSVNNLIKNMKSVYNELICQGVKNEDARSILPNCCATQLVATYNARSLFNLFNLRISNNAQNEIRELCIKMLNECKKVAPIIFNKF